MDSSAHSTIGNQMSVLDSGVAQKSIVTAQ